MNALLLDTHVWFWFVTGSEQLKKPVRKIINEGASKGELTIAAITLWEIGMLEAKKRIILEMPCLEWLNKAIQTTHTRIQPLTPSIAVESCNLPDSFHGDPADRLIVATARVDGLTVVTRDERMIAYSRKKYISIVKA